MSRPHPAGDPEPVVVWSVAGSDSGGGAGLQADLKTFDAFGVHGCTAVAALTAQNSQRVLRVQAVDTPMLDAQLAALAEDLPPAAIKLGLLGSVENLRCVLGWVDRLRRERPVALVLDPVRRATTGATFADEALRRGFLDEAVVRATVVTPNRAEAAWLLGRDRLTDDEVPEAAAALRARGAQAVAITGGDAAAATDGTGGPDGGEARASDWIDTPQARGWLSLARVETAHHHGTGCVFASAAAAALARGHCEADALVLAKQCTTTALAAAYPAGRGAGPVRPVPGFAQVRGGLPTLHPHRPVWPPPAGRPLEEPRLGLYAVVDSAERVEQVLAAGARTVQLRIKQASKQVLRGQIRRAAMVARAAGAQLFVNDHWSLAIETGAHGVHLGQEDLAAAGDEGLRALQEAGMRLGISTHSVWEVCRARAAGPSYIACGPIHATRTKQMPWTPQGEDNLAYWCQVLEEPVVAIAGMDEARSREAVRCGAAGVAVLRGLAGDAGLADVVARLQAAIAEGARLARRGAPPMPRPTLARGHSPDGRGDGAAIHFGVSHERRMHR